MPRSGWRKAESDRRLPDLVSVGRLVKVFPAEVVDAVVAECGRTEQRRRSLPGRSMVYFAMGMALHSEGSYQDVLALISDGLAWAQRGDGSGKLANKAAISHARVRLGPEPMALLFERVAKPMGAKDTPGCWLASGRHRWDLSGPAGHASQRQSFRAARGEQGRTISVSPSPSRRVGRVRYPRGIRRRDRPLHHVGGRPVRRAARAADTGDVVPGRLRVLQLQSVGNRLWERG